LVINRDAAFWDRIASHPAVAPHIFMGGEPQSLAPLVENPKAHPYASANGGAIFSPVDPLGFVVEMHTLYTPEGWGREVATFGKQFINDVLQTASLILTHEQEGHWRSRPPKSHGWQACGDYVECGFPHRLKLWALSREAWFASPVGRKMQCL
jgi:hypothetical protein